MSKLKHAELTEQILRCAFEVHSCLGTGFLEKVYENALYWELQKCGLSVEKQKPVTVFYKGQIVGEYIVDLIIEDKVLVELKAVEKTVDAHEVQLKNYLQSTNIEIGLLLNFGNSVQVRRKFVENRSREIPRSS